jgi:hypothetical protein
MAELRDNEKTAYVELVQELLNCPPGEEQALLLLETRPELVDKNLVNIMLQAAEFLQYEEGEGYTALWLRSFARKLGKQLGLNQVAEDNGCGHEELDFLYELIQASMENSQQIQELFAQNLHHLGANGEFGKNRTLSLKLSPCIAFESRQLSWPVSTS